MPAILIVLIAVLATTISIFAAMRVHPTQRMRGWLMMSTGVGMVVFGLVTMLATDEPLAIPLGGTGLVFIAVGGRLVRAAGE